MKISKNLENIINSAKKKNNILTLIAVLLPLWLIGISGFLFAYPSFRIVDGNRQWMPDFDGVLMTLLISIFTIVLWVLAAYTGWIDKFFAKAKAFFSRIKANPGKLCKHAVIFIAIPVIVIVVLLIVHNVPLTSRFFMLRVFFFTALGVCVYFMILFREKPEKLFFSLTFTIGVMYVFMHPAYFYGWDQQIHYAWAVESSFVRYVSVSESEIFNIIWGGRIGLTGRHNFEHMDVTVFSYRLGTDVITQNAHLFAFPPPYVRLGHIPAGVMIFIARSLTLPANIAMIFALLGQHLLYITVIYFAIKRLITGKYIMAVIAMFPTAFVLSTTFGYDYWLIAFSMLGTAYAIRELQEPDKPIELKNLVIMIGAFFLAMGPKAVYFPLMLILYLIKRSKFETKKGYIAYILSVSGVVLFVVGTFMLPFIASGGGGVGAGDHRGGNYISATDQTMFILQNPLEYIGILLNFIRGYLSLTTLRFSSVSFAFLNYASYYFIIWLLLFFVTLTDRGENDALSSTVRNKLIMTVLSLGAIAFPATAMYILFTNVGAEYIGGMQARYILPILFPFAAMVGGVKIKNSINKAVYSCIVFAVMSFMLLNSAWEIFVPNVV